MFLCIFLWSSTPFRGLQYPPLSSCTLLYLLLVFSNLPWSPITCHSLPYPPGVSCGLPSSLWWPVVSCTLIWTFGSSLGLAYPYCTLLWSPITFCTFVHGQLYTSVVSHFLMSPVPTHTGLLYPLMPSFTFMRPPVPYCGVQWCPMVSKTSQGLLFPLW